jgi:hypothetical protein
MRYQAAPLPDCPQLERIVVLANPTIGSVCGWWARQDSNLQPSRYERPALPLSYRPSPAPMRYTKARATAKAQPRGNISEKESRVLSRSPPAIRARPLASRNENPP